MATEFTPLLFKMFCHKSDMIASSRGLIIIETD